MRLPNPNPSIIDYPPKIVWVVSLFLLLILFVSCNRPEISKEEKRAKILVIKFCANMPRGIYRPVSK
ncbi:MAG: hypothetical protein CM1200mP3_05140 [Chloroflexota bacterium]|nr:MAG: hypothetical protein CM1200mP3_05140 [Chloroflexota bacterium]